MSLKYGLNVKKAAPPPKRKTIFDDVSGDEDDTETNTENRIAAVEEITTLGSPNGLRPPPSLPRPSKSAGVPRISSLDQDPVQTDASSAAAAKAKLKEAESLDPSIFDYDTFLTAKESVTAKQKEAARQDAIERKPKYINNLLTAAERRKQDQLVAREKFLQRERENEGEEFEDKEKFVTGAYREMQESNRKIEEEEQRRKEEEEKKKRAGEGMSAFYKGMMDQREKAHQEAMEAAEKMGEGVQLEGRERERIKSDAEIAKEMREKGVNVHLNEEGQMTDKRELLTAGLNIGSGGGSANKGSADHLRSSNVRTNQSAFAKRDDQVGKQAQRERQSRMVEEQIAAQAKRAREEEEQEREEAERKAKSAKTETEVGDARARYLARKAAKEREKAGA